MTFEKFYFNQKMRYVYQEVDVHLEVAEKILNFGITTVL